MTFTLQSLTLSWHSHHKVFWVVLSTWHLFVNVIVESALQKKSISSLLLSKLSGGQNCGMVWDVTASDKSGNRIPISALLCMAFQLWIVTEEANGLPWWKTRQLAAQCDELSSPDQIPDPVLNIVMYYKKKPITNIWEKKVRELIIMTSNFHDNVSPFCDNDREQSHFSYSQFLYITKFIWS